MQKMFGEIMSLPFDIRKMDNFEFSASQKIEACCVLVIVNIDHALNACLQYELTAFFAWRKCYV